MAATPQLPEQQSFAKIGRPSEFDPELALLICTQLVRGKSLRAILRENENMPDMSTIFYWLHRNKEFSQQYAQARAIQAEGYAEEIVEISDEVPTCEVPDPDGGVSIRVDGAGVQRNRLRVDARKWVASKLLPKKFGDVQPDISVNPIVQINIVAPAVEPRHNPADLKPEFDVIEGK